MAAVGTGTGANWAAIVYDDLRLVKRWSEVEVLPLVGDRGDYLVLIGKPFGEEKVKVVVPWAVVDPIRHDQIQAVFRSISQRYPDLDHCTFAFVSCDSTITYFVMHNGLLAVEPVAKSAQK